MTRTQKTIAVLLGLFLFAAVVDFSAKIFRFAQKTLTQPKSERTGKKRPSLVQDEYLGWFAPNQVNVRMNSVGVNINSLGFRGAELTGRPRRVFCMGDSVTFGWSASGDDGTYPAFLAKRLAAAEADAVNAGIPRSNAMSMFQCYLAKVRYLKADAVVILVGWNDICYGFYGAYQRDRKKTAAELACEMFDSAAILKTAASVALQAKILRDRETAKDSVKWDQLDHYEGILRAMVLVARQNHSRPVLVTLPHFLNGELTDAKKKTMLSYLLAMPELSYGGWRRVVAETNRRIRTIATDLKVPLVDCEDRIGVEHFADVCHLKDSGNEILADCVAETVRKVLAENLTRPQ